MAEKWSSTGGLNGPLDVLTGGGGLRLKERFSKLGVRPVFILSESCWTEVLRDCIMETKSTGLGVISGETTCAFVFAVTDNGMGL